MWREEAEGEVERRPVSIPPNSGQARHVTEWKGPTWSDVVYPGTDMYSRLVMFDLSGVSGSSEYVVYSTLSVQDGVRWELSRRRSEPHEIREVLKLPVTVNFTNTVLVCALQKPSVDESYADYRPRSKLGGQTLNFQKSPSLSPTNTEPFFCSTLSWSYSFSSSRLLSLSSAETRASWLSGPRKGCVSGRSSRKLRSPKKKR